MSKHTPGPWVITEDNCGECAIDSGDFHICQTLLRPFRPGDGSPDSADSLQCARGFCHDEEALANANLIAAAPDLLEALEDAVKWLYPVIDSRHEQEQVDCITKIVEAISKAKGE